MTPPRLNILQKPTYKFASSNYVNYDGSLESLNTARISADTPWNGTLSFDIGADINFKQTGANISTTTNPALEVKYKQNIATVGNTTFRGCVRYRNIGNSNQLRFSAGASTKLNDRCSIYADGHYTTKFDGSCDKVGGWVGVDYKVNSQISLWCEPVQYNKTLGGKSSWSSNLGVTVNL